MPFTLHPTIARATQHPATWLLALSFALAGPAHAEPRAPKHGAHAPKMSMATAAFESITLAQLEIAKRVFTGRARCEHGHSVDVQAVPDKPGFFHVAFGGSRYLMVPEETSSGAVRLFDRHAGVVWLQIPVKSMLMNQKMGQRLLDGCQAPEQASATQTASASLVR